MGRVMGGRGELFLLFNLCRISYEATITLKHRMEERNEANTPWSNQSTKF